MKNPYDERYAGRGYYWGKTPSQTCYRVLQLLPPYRPRRLLDIGCGEGRTAVFFARNGYHVTAFDTSPKGVEKTKQLAADAGVQIEAFVAGVLYHPIMHRLFAHPVPDRFDVADFRSALRASGLTPAREEHFWHTLFWLVATKPGSAQPGAAPNGGPATLLDDSGVAKGMPSVS